MARTICTIGAKGGSGKTLITANLAFALADEGMRVCLVDLDTRIVGDMARMLNIIPEKSMADLINFLKKQPTLAKKEDFVSKSDFNKNVDFLAGILRPQQAVHLVPEMFRDAFAFLDKDYDYIIIDGGAGFTDTFLAALNQANLTLLIVTPDALSVFQARWVLDTLQALHFPLNMVKLLLNRAESVSSISWQEICVSLPIEIIHKIPSEGRLVNEAVNQGMPVVVASPRSKISLAIKKLAQTLIDGKGLFVERKSVDQIKIKEAAAEEPGRFWEDQELVEPVAEPDVDEADTILVLKRRIHARLIEGMNIKRLSRNVFNDPKKSKELRNRAEVTVANLLVEEAGSFIPSQGERRKLIKEILDEALGLGPLEDLLADPDITDIMVNNKNEVYIEKHGKIELTDKRFISNEQVRTIIERIIAPIGRRIDESVPMVDARLADGSRVNAIIPPLSLTGPTLTIRKFRKERLKTEDLIQYGALSQGMANFIKASVLCRKNIIVSGGTGSGKTTVLNALSEYISEGERIVTLEDAAELKLNQAHWVRLEARPPNIESRGGVAIRDLFRNTLRMRPDRIIVGECRGSESLDMLQAMNTEHDGSMTTIHANSTLDVLSRLDSMILMSGVELPVRTIREMIASAVDLIVHTARLSDGSRKIMAIAEINGMKDDMHIGMSDIFIFKQTGVDSKGRVLGYFTATGYEPSFLNEIKIRGISMPDGIFKPTTAP
jgi:pilus assembly protein CpaF